jgi:hypothetical protein
MLTSYAASFSAFFRSSDAFLATSRALDFFTFLLDGTLGAFSSAHLESKMLFASNFLKKLNKKVCLLLLSRRCPLKKLATLNICSQKQNKVLKNTLTKLSEK